jgi:hypothetical protein
MLPAEAEVAVDGEFLDGLVELDLGISSGTRVSGLSLDFLGVGLLEHAFFDQCVEESLFAGVGCGDGCSSNCQGCECGCDATIQHISVGDDMVVLRSESPTGGTIRLWPF